MKNIIFLFALILFSSCSVAIIGEDQPDTQTNNFDIFWNDFEQHYSLFTVRDINWNELYNVYRPQVNDEISDEELWSILSNLIEHLDDSHTTLYDGNGHHYTSGYLLNEQSSFEISEELIISKYLDFVTEIPSEDRLLYGKVKDKNIGYIYLGVMDGENPAIIDKIAEELKDYDAIIFDIRQNEGGDDRYSARIAQAFSDGEHFIYTAQTRNGVSYDDFDEIKEFYTHPNQENSYVKPVIILTDRATISAGETLLSYMKSYEHVIQVGDTTAGDFSTQSNMRFLPNSWHYIYSIQKVLFPNGESLDGVGHVPDIYIKNTAADISALNDKVFDRAIQYLFEEHNIE
ncbi:S41 family peptidase [Aureibaculum luteum]|uniref:S41 family peptidase n=1 Tax=Aureibaculum luteum TaxID=1548456 RepID=UPI000E50F64C|nr:S41 family peptidase [Aureibaculum luteum]